MILTYFRENSNYIGRYLLEESYSYKKLLSKEMKTYCLVCFDVYREQRSSILVLLTGNDVPPSFVFLKGERRSLSKNSKGMAFPPANHH